jgi:hypothetical protein
LQLYLLVLETAPEWLAKDGIERPLAPLDTALHASGQRPLALVRAAEVARLVAVPASRCRQPHGQLQRFQYKREFQGLIQWPAHDRARLPLQDRQQIQPAAAQTDRADIHSPDLIRMGRGDMAQQKGIDAMLPMPFAEVGAREAHSGCFSAAIRRDR